MLELTKMNNINNNFKQELIDNGYNEIIVNLLVNRGYDEETICTLLSTGYSEELPIYNDLTNVQIGADIIESHIANGSRIYIYGDYDSDGVNSTYILGDAINNAIYYSNSSAQLSLKVPERCEGYGLNMSWCQSIVANKTTDTLVITVDNGIAQDQEVAYLLDNGIDVLITDHHTPNGHTPANVWIIDAFHNNDNENNKGLCGAGVAFKLAMSLLDRFQCVPNIDELYYKYIVHVAIATITDSMPMTIDNIKYVYNGIQLLKDGYGSEAVTYYRDYNSNTDLTPKDIAFGLGPQINACGRMNNTALALNYLFSDNEDVEDLYNEVVVTNDERKAKTKSSIEQAEKMLDIESPSIVLELDGIEGIAGIIASNLASKYNKCTIVFSKIGDVLIGSARSDGHIDLLKVLKNTAEYTDFIVKVGGHAGACGITIKDGYLNNLADSLEACLSAVPKIKMEPVSLDVIVDDYITLSDVTKNNCDYLRSLYFFTESNPVFAINNVIITKVKYSGNNPNNVCFDLKDKSGTLQTWAWGVGDMYKALKEPKQVTIIAELDSKFGKPSLNILNIIPKKNIK
jgi:single-stranded-DNA-specific exonuclease